MTALYISPTLPPLPACLSFLALRSLLILALHRLCQPLFHVLPLLALNNQPGPPQPLSATCMHS